MKNRILALALAFALICSVVASSVAIAAEGQQSSENICSKWVGVWKGYWQGRTGWVISNIELDTANETNCQLLIDYGDQQKIPAVTKGQDVSFVLKSGTTIRLKQISESKLYAFGSTSDGRTGSTTFEKMK